jgi:hypothetical protein
MFSINTDDLPQMRRYAAALNKYESTSPIRGREEDTRPLGKRSKCNMRIEKNGEEVRAVLYGTPVLTYTPDDIVTINTGSWTTVSSNKFIGALLGTNCGSFNGKSVLYAENGVFLMKDGMRVRWELGDNGTSRLNVLDYYPSVVHKVRRSVLKQKRENIKEFWEYTENLAAITPKADVPLDTESQLLMRDKNHGGDAYCEKLVGKVLALGGKPDYEEMLTLWKTVAFLSCPCDMQYDRDQGRWKAITALVNQKSMLLFVNNALKWHYRDEVFETIVLPRGEVKTDINHKYFY